MEDFMPKGLRKGGWTEEEDDLLKKYILKFGEGRWHQAPLRAGLNRCRKSCRMRWLNYLRPDIKRGYFEEDEVDLLLKLHRLLGNRWALIAGRLPGRTANDVKNYWNNHLMKNRQQKSTKKTPVQIKGKSSSNMINAVKTTVVKPCPRTLYKASTPWVWKNKDRTDNKVNTQLQYTANICSDMIQNQKSWSELESDKWWERLLFDEELDRAMTDHVHDTNGWENLLFNKDDDNATGKRD